MAEQGSRAAEESEPSPVLFDLFGTLVPGGTRTERDATSRAMALDLDVDPDDFVRALRGTFDERAHGRLGSLGETVSTLAERVGGRPSPEAVRRAADRRIAMELALFSRSWAVPVLTELRRRGHRLGLVSDCSAELPDIWPETQLAPFFSAVAFSCEVGVRKPDPRIYRIVTDALHVDPAVCCYVGDGASHELGGARRLGMRAVWFDHDQVGVDRPGAESGDRLERIVRLDDLLTLLDSDLRTG